MLDRPYRPPGTEVEMSAATAGDALTIQVTPNYGQIYVTPPPTI
jgi:hypothetical protein